MQVRNGCLALQVRKGPAGESGERVGGGSVLVAVALVVRQGVRVCLNALQYSVCAAVCCFPTSSCGGRYGVWCSGHPWSVGGDHRQMQEQG